MKTRTFGALAAVGVGAAVFGGACSMQKSEDGGSSGAGNAATTGGSSGSSTAGSGGGAMANTGSTPGINVPVVPDAGAGDGGVEDLRDASCAGWTAEPEELPAVMQLVVDVSGSMNDPAPGDADMATKWLITRNALASAVDSLPPTTSLGVLYYPNRNTDGTNQQMQEVTACINVDALLPVALLGGVGSAQRLAIADSLGRATPDGFTPTHDAYDVALEQGLVPAAGSGNRYMLLITDGAPTLSQGCQRGPGGGGGVSVVATDPIVGAITAARGQGIKTFVVGSPGSEDGDDGEDMRPWLSKAAIEGDTAKEGCAEAGPSFCHFDMTEEPNFEVALTQALEEIVGAVVSCSYELPEPPSGQTLDLGKINAVFTPGSGETEIIGQSTVTGACTQGWQLVNNRVELCSDTCARIQNDNGGRFELLFGCEAITQPPE